MDTKIDITLDIYRNRFSEITEYAYYNIKAVNANEQEIVDNCIEQMILNNNETLIYYELDNIFGNAPLIPIEKNKIGKLNITQQKFEF